MGTVSELAAAGKPAILVPLPTASDHHQLRNAEAFVKAGAGVLVTDSEMTGQRLVEEVMALAADPGCSRRWAKIGAGVREAGRGSAGCGCAGDHWLKPMPDRKNCSR